MSCNSILLPPQENSTHFENQVLWKWQNVLHILQVDTGRLFTTQVDILCLSSSDFQNYRTWNEELFPLPYQRPSLLVSHNINWAQRNLHSTTDSFKDSCNTKQCVLLNSSFLVTSIKVQRADTQNKHGDQRNLRKTCDHLIINATFFFVYCASSILPINIGQRSNNSLEKNIFPNLLVIIITISLSFYTQNIQFMEILVIIHNEAVISTTVNISMHSEAQCHLVT